MGFIWFHEERDSIRVGFSGGNGLSNNDLKLPQAEAAAAMIDDHQLLSSAQLSSSPTQQQPATRKEEELLLLLLGSAFVLAHHCRDGWMDVL